MNTQKSKKAFYFALSIVLSIMLCKQKKKSWKISFSLKQYSISTILSINVFIQYMTFVVIERTNQDKKKNKQEYHTFNFWPTKSRDHIQVTQSYLILYCRAIRKMVVIEKYVRGPCWKGIKIVFIKRDWMW